MTVKSKKKDQRDGPGEAADKILDKAEKMIRGLKMPGFADWVKVTVIGRLEYARPRMMPGFGPPDDSRALPPEAEPEPEWETCKPFRTTFRASEVSEFCEGEKGIIIFRHSMGPNSRILVKENWDEVCEALGAVQVAMEGVPAEDQDGAPWEE